MSGEINNRYIFPRSELSISIDIIADEYNENLVQYSGSSFYLDTNDQILKDYDIISASYNDDNLSFHISVGTTASIMVAEYPNTPFTADAEWRVGFTYDGVKYGLIWYAHFTTDFSY